MNHTVSMGERKGMAYFMVRHRKHRRDEVKDSVMRRSFSSLLLKDKNAYNIYKETESP